MKKRRPPGRVVVALANRMARAIWVVLAHGRAYQKVCVSVHPVKSEQTLLAQTNHETPRYWFRRARTCAGLEAALSLGLQKVYGALSAVKEL
jgi:hypothetical protein